ncbi:DUF6456 domain-containing protein [Alisedimentitalea sp. MJ-SS2]|uniref:DUF6456 domain-containing protein n=1 Tax=Aliisedimentitalea sp. MJ-SS2 TaxID=3049795 RepID=UPI0029139DF0|nr:DUF6456 domain-containing protein [Alisedimentitalea sp. MJ-SS2]MDU8926881.1 DUF6456 domain-containing protein [Alisedimentitalea sp. MJ-SS2]
MPTWVPRSAGHYLIHTEWGVSIRALARRASCHPSTILRQVRRFENLRDDFLIDEALRNLGRVLRQQVGTAPKKAPREMSFPQQGPQSGTDSTPDDETLDREARRVLRRLCERGAVLAVSSEMDKAVVVRDTASGATKRTAVVDRAVAQALALKNWIACAQPGKVARYRVTQAGRAAMSRMVAEAENMASGFADAQTPFLAQHGGLDAPVKGQAKPKARFHFGESPLTALARRKDRDGQPFLMDDLVAAGDRLREDFELAQMGPRTGQNWERFLTGPVDEGMHPGDRMGGSRAARDRVAGALRDLGPRLGDVVLRCCCYLEGLEMTEKRMGWSARSGKIVLRIALQRLKRHYEELGEVAGMIG